MEIDFNFDPRKFVYPETGVVPVSNDIWDSLDDINGIPFTNRKFYVPKSEIGQDWPKKLKDKFGIVPFWSYDIEIAHLPFLVTDDMIQAMKDKVGDQREMSAEEYLEFASSGLHGKLSSLQLQAMFSDKPFEIKLNDWEQKLLRWRSGHGYLVPSKDMQRSLFGSRPKPGVTLTNRVENEYIFRVPRDYYSGIVLSLGQEPDTDGVHWGFRRDLATDWPFNYDPKKEKVSEDRQLLEMIAPMEPFVEKMNYLTFNLENTLNGI